jgi:hypothetical protein
MIKSCCENCGWKYKVSEEFARKIAKCKKCGKPILIPSIGNSEFSKELQNVGTLEKDVKKKAHLPGVVSYRTAEQSPLSAKCAICGNTLAAAAIRHDIEVFMYILPENKKSIKCYHCNAELPYSKILPAICPKCNADYPLGIPTVEGSTYNPYTKTDSHWCKVVVPRCFVCAERFLAHDKKVFLRAVLGCVAGVLLGLIVPIWIFVTEGFGVPSPGKQLEHLNNIILVCIGPPILAGAFGMVISFSICPRPPEEKAIKEFPPIQRLLQAGWTLGGSQIYH